MLVFDVVSVPNAMTHEVARATAAPYPPCFGDRATMAEPLTVLDEELALFLIFASRRPPAQTILKLAPHLSHVDGNGMGRICVGSRFSIAAQIPK